MYKIMLYFCNNNKKFREIDSSFHFHEFFESLEDYTLLEKKSSYSYHTFDANFVGLRLFDRGHHPFTFISILFTRFPKCFRRIVIEAGHHGHPTGHFQIQRGRDVDQTFHCGFGLIKKATGHNTIGFKLFRSEKCKKYLIFTFNNVSFSSENTIFLKKSREYLYQ